MIALHLIVSLQYYENDIEKNAFSSFSTEQAKTVYSLCPTPFQFHVHLTSSCQITTSDDGVNSKQNILNV